MSPQEPHTERLRVVRQIVVVVALLTCLVGAFSQTLEALEKRESIVSAADLRLAVLAVAPVNDISNLSPAEYELFASSLDVLRKADAEALRALDPAQRQIASDQISLLLSHANTVESSRGTATGTHNLARNELLLDLLRSASINAADEASKAEQLAGGAAVASLALLGLVMAGATRARMRTQSVEATADAFRSAADRFGVLLEQSPDATALLAPGGSVTYASESMTALLGSAPTELDDFAKLALPSEQARLTEHLLASGGVRAALDIHSCLEAEQTGGREFRVLVTDLSDDPVVRGNLITVTETTLTNQTRRQLEYLAGHDQLTGLPNRRSLLEDLDQREPFALLMIDLDGFKQTNDTLGHAAGDELLIAVARRISGRLGHAGTLYRLGGDEFAVVALDPETDAHALAENLLVGVDEPIKLSVGFERASASIGVAERDAGDPDLSMLQRADLALYEAKRRGGRTVRVLDQGLERDAIAQADLSRALETATFDDEFHLAFQPIVEAATHTTRLIEALARWTSPIHGQVGPDRFVPMAEASGRIVELGDWVLDQALGTLARLRADGLPADVQMSVNVSPFQMGGGGLVPRVADLLATHGIEPQALTLELTESSLVTNDVRILDQLTELREFGCSIACDDFGSGYSNLGQLMTLPLNVVKVDRQLLLTLSDMREQAGGSSEQPFQVMSAIAQIGDAMNAQVVAEGVETHEQAISLRDSGIRLLQGYYFSRPVAADELFGSMKFAADVRVPSAS